MNIILDKEYFKKLDDDLQLITLTYDFAFKKTFRSNLDILREFLKVVIPLDIDDECKIRLMDGELPKENKREKKKVIDIYVVLDGKIYVDIEMNRNKFELVLERNIKYKDKLSSMIPESGEDIKHIKDKKLYQWNLNAYLSEDILDDIVVLYGLKSNKIYSKSECMVVKSLERYRELYYNECNRNKDVIRLTALTSRTRTFTKLYELISQVLPEDKVKRFMEGAINMSKDEFVLHAWNKEKFDELVKNNEIEFAKKEGKAKGIKENQIQVVKNMLKENISTNIISKVTGLTEKSIQNLIKNDTKNN